MGPINVSLVWLAIVVVLCIIEALTVSLTTIWFAGGALVAALVAQFTDNFWIQMAVFIAVSWILVYFTKPIIQKRLKQGEEKTNVDALIGTEGIVLTDILPLNVGQVRIGGNVWSALMNDSNQSAVKDEVVRVVRIEGVKLIVEKIITTE